jgi:membrane-bound metal-dependent hydrolase YbcI (DUF457 family)
MYFFTHLLVGIIIGVILSLYFRDNYLILACALGSVLPDLIDKPVGILLFADTIGYGQIYCHTLLFAGLVFIIALLGYSLYPRIGLLILGLAVGIFSHQLLDAMWFKPVNWFWPTQGPFIGRERPDFFWNAFKRTIKNPIEWFTGGIILAFFIIVYFIPYYRESPPSGSLKSKWNRRALWLIMSIITAAAVILLGGIYFE